MSRTDKTRPWQVRASDLPMVTCYPIHDHTRGGCTLPPNPTQAWGPRGDHRCYWQEAPDFYYRRGGGCGCRMCTGYHERREDRRRERHAARVSAQQLVKQHRRGRAG